MKTFIVRFKGTPPNHYDAPRARFVVAETKDSARILADRLANRDGFIVSSVRQYHHTHDNNALIWN